MGSLSLDTITLTTAVAAMRARKLSAVELLAAVHQRYVETEPVLHGWVERFTEARAQAVTADRRIAGGATAPLLGVPIGIKDIFDVAGSPTRCNSPSREDVPVAHRDAEPVHRLRKAGTVLLGKTVTQEFAAGVVSAPARNPWNPHRVPGGSSGGSAASVSAGTSLGALGSDTGGSIRIPASVTGTVGLKPTYGSLDLTGTFPLSVSLDTVGPITRTVADAVAMHLVLANRHAEVLEAVAHLDRLAVEPSLTGVRLGVMRGFFNHRLQSGVAEAFEQAVRALAEQGAELMEIDWQLAEAARASALLISRVESAAVHHRLLRENPELIGDDVRYRFEVGALLTGDTYLRAKEARRAARDSIRHIYREHELAAVVAPTTPAVAPSAARLEVTFSGGAVENVGAALTRLTMPWNATGQPALSVPCGFDHDGMPVGLSFVGKPNDELRLAEIAQHYEQATDWHRRRPSIGGRTDGLASP